MLKDEYKAIYDRIQPSRSLEAETEAQIMAHFDGKKLIKPVSRTTVIAIALAVLLVGTAIAATLQSNILSNLFRGRTPSPEAEAALVRDAGQVSDAGITLTLDEYLADQNTLNLSWTVTSQRDEPVYYVTWAEIDDQGLTEADEAQGYVPGFPYGSSDESIGDNALVRLAPGAIAYTSYTSWGWAHGIDRALTARVFVRAYTTDLVMKQTDFRAPELYCMEPGDAACAVVKDIEAAGGIPMACNLPLCYVGSYDAYRQALGNGTEPEEICDALAASGLFQPLKDLTLEVEIAEPIDTAGFELAEPQTFELPGRTVELKAMKFDIASTLIRYDVILDNDADANAATCWYLVAGPDGQVKNVEWSLSLSGSEAETTERDGKSCTVIHYDLGSDSPVTDLPESLTFIPVSDLPREEGEPSTAYWQRVADQAKAEDCFTVKLK